MSKFPTELDDDVTLPPVNNNITEVGAEALNACRDALFAIENEIGTGASGSAGSISSRLGLSLEPDGTIKTSAIASLGLVTLPIFNYHIAENAQITESKLRLDFRTQDLFNYIRDLSRDINEAIGWIDITGIKLDPHLLGGIYRHELFHIDVSTTTTDLLQNKFDILRDNESAYTVLADINDDLIQHQKADGSLVSSENVTTYNGSVYPSNFGHISSGLFVNTSRFSTIPQTATSVQAVIDFIDSASIFLYGTRIQNLYANGISRISRSSVLDIDGYGQAIIPPTTAITYFLTNGTGSLPVDDIDTGDDIIEFTPTDDVLDNNLFDSQFALIKSGDIVRVNYGSVEVPFIIREKKYIEGDGIKKFILRINGRNLFYTTTASARVDKPLFNQEKYGVLSVSAANNEFNTLPSLIVGSPRSASALGLGFNAQLLDSTHYILYLALFTTGHPADGYTFLPGIDITGNSGTTPGAYTLDSVIQVANDAFREKGFNYRFVAFQYKGEFGVMLADSYGNAGFSIVNGVVDSDGLYDENFTNVFFPNNVVGLFGVDDKVAPDPLGFGVYGSAVASPPYLGDYPTPESALIPTKLFLPLKRNNYYVNGIEREKLNIDVGQAIDEFGDGYWIGTITGRVVFPNNRVKVSYRVDQNLATSKLREGKTLVIQSNGSGTLVDYGRFIIESLAYDNCSDDATTGITVYDAVHAVGFSPTDTMLVGNEVKIYFSSDSVEFNTENSTDISSVIPSFKRHFEVLTTSDGNVFTHERARMNINGSNLTVNDVDLYSSSQLAPFNLIRISPKLRGYKFFSGTSTITKINLNIISYDNDSGIYDGYLSMYDGSNFTRIGTQRTGRIGDVTRFYDESGLDFIEVIYEFNDLNSFTNKNIDIQLFPTLQLDEEIFPIATCQVNDVTSQVEYIKDIRDFGNVSEKQFTSSALNFLSAGDRYLHENGVIRGFDLTEDEGNPVKEQIRLKGGIALVNGNLVQMNASTVSIPRIKQAYLAIDADSDGTLDTYADTDLTWALCVNEKSEFQAIPLLLNTSDSNAQTYLSVINPVNASIYNIDGVIFPDLINNRKDLCILYVVASTVTGSSTLTDISLEVTDARKYANDIGSNLPLKLTSSTSQGNFRDPIAIFNWIKFNNSFNGRANLKGADATIDLALNLNFDNLVTIEGENNASLVFSERVTVGSNVTFKDLTLTFNGGFAVTSGSSNVHFENCIININNTDQSSYLFTFNQHNYSIKDCTLNISWSEVTTLGDLSIFFIAGSSKFKMDNTTINVEYQEFTGIGNNFCGDIFRVYSGVVGTSDIEITGSTFAGNFHRFINIAPSTLPVNLKVRECTITSTRDTSTDSGLIGSTTTAWSSTDLVNCSSGLIFAKVGSTISDISIEKCVFNFSPTTASSNRLSAICFQLSSTNAAVKNLIVRDCQFNNTSAEDDKRAAIAVINTAPYTSSATSAQPLLLNMEITNNTCNKNQMIILTSKIIESFAGFDWMIYPGLMAINCTIDGNICGTIGYYVSSGTRVNNIPTFTAFNNGPHLNITNNDCHYIATLGSEGEYFSNFATDSTSTTQINASLYPSGHVKIVNNTANWIHAACAFEEHSSLLIEGNTLNCYDIAYMDSYRDNATYITTTLAWVIPTYKYAIVVNGNCYNVNSYVPGIGNDSCVIISNNITSTGLYVNSLSVPVTYEYGGYICAMTSATITGNILKGIGDDVTAHTGSVGISAGGPVTYINENRIYRGVRKIYAYINNKHPYSTASVTASFGNISNNYFDKSTNDNASDTTKAKNTQVSWTYDRNKNQ